jgi:ADP-ribose pyrophosphatase YjhB (NUDIX family)
MNPITSEQVTFDNRNITLSWFNTSPDQNIKASQVSAYCIYDNKLLLVKNKRGWGIPGGHPELGESLDEALARELNEEAGIIPGEYTSKIIGWTKVEDPDNIGVEGKESSQVKYLVVLNNLPEFVPNDEIFERTLINLEDFEKYVSWGTSPTGKAQLTTLKENLEK